MGPYKQRQTSSKRQIGRPLRATVGEDRTTAQRSIPRKKNARRHPPPPWPRQPCGLPVGGAALSRGLGAPLQSAAAWAEGLSHTVQKAPRRARPAQGGAEGRCRHTGGHASGVPPGQVPAWPEQDMAGGKNRGVRLHGGGGGRSHGGCWRALRPATEPPWREHGHDACRDQVRGVARARRWRRSGSLARPTGAPPPAALRGPERARARALWRLTRPRPLSYGEVRRRVRHVNWGAPAGSCGRKELYGGLWGLAESHTVILHFCCFLYYAGVHSNESRSTDKRGPRRRSSSVARSCN